MNKKFYFFCIFLLVFSVVFHGFSALETGSGSGSNSGSMNAPLVKYKEWQIGRSDKGTNSSDKVHTSFITSTKTECRFKASVGYQGGSQPQNTSPIDPDTVKWDVIDANHSMTFDKSSMSKNWSGKHPSKFDTSTSFNVVAKVTVPEYETDTSCTANDANRADRTPVHRGNTKLAFKIKFTANTEDGQKVEVMLPLKQDDKDQIRQEYVDLNKPIPSRGDSKWAGENTYDFGHYKQMLDDGLSGNFQAWIDAMNTRERIGKTDANGNPLKSLKKADFTLNSGYRNPHHNYRHAGSSVVLSSHMYGYALDVDGKNIDGKSGADQQKMVDAAGAANPNARFSQKYRNKTHVHADWAPSDWADRPTSSDKTKYTAGDPLTFSLPAAGTDTRGNDETPQNPLTDPMTANAACGIHPVSASGSHTSYTCNISPCSNFVWWGCVYAQCPETSSHGTTTITPGDEDTSGGTTPTTPTASLGPDIGYSTTITLGSQTLLVLQASAAFRSVTWYILSPENDSESWMGTHTYSDGATTATYVPYFGSGVGDYQVRVEITPVTGDTYSVSCTVTVQ